MPKPPLASEATLLSVLARLGEILTAVTASNNLLQEAVTTLGTLPDYSAVLAASLVEVEHIHAHIAACEGYDQIAQDLLNTLNTTAESTEEHQKKTRIHNYLIEALTRAHLAAHAGEAFVTENLRAILPPPEDI